MNGPLAKFLRCVRIHNEDCGAVARALHHEAIEVTRCLADLERVSWSTTERK